MKIVRLNFQNSKIPNSKASSILIISNLRDSVSYESNTSDASSCFLELVREEASPLIYKLTKLLDANN